MSAAEFLQTAEPLPEAMLLLTAAGVIVAANRAAAELLGAAPAQLAGRHLGELTSGPPEALAAYLRDCARSRQLLPGAVTVSAGAGEPVACLGEGAVFRPRDDGDALVLLRLTPKREALAQFAVLNQQIEALGREVARRQQLEEERDELLRREREAGRRKDEWLAMLAHELGGPLNPIRAAAELVERHAPAVPELRRAGEIIGRQVRHTARIIDDLLDVTRIVRGEMRLRPERLDLARLVRTAADDFRPTLEGAGRALECELPETPVWVQGDATRLAQVVDNLLDNALRFTDAGGRVGVRVTADAAGRRAVLVVRDTGIG